VNIIINVVGHCKAVRTAKIREKMKADEMNAV
jgi:hypothetical protein